MDNAKVISDDTQDQVSDNQEKKQSENVSYDSYRKLLGEKKKESQKRQELEERLARYEQDKLELEGKKDEALTSWKKKAEQFETELKQTKEKFAWNTIESQIKAAALEHGCTNTNALMKLLDKSALKQIEVGDNFEVDREGVSKLIEESKKQFADLNLFGKRKVEVHDVTGKQKIKAPSIDEMLANAKTPDDVAKLLKQLN